MKNRINKLRELFQVNNIDCYLLPSTDEFLSEYPPAFLKRLEYILGFGCSNGFLFVSRNKILFVTDGRYITAAKRYEDTEFEVFDVKNFSELSEHSFFDNIRAVGYNEEFFNKRLLSFFEKLSLKIIKEDLVSKIWEERPSAPKTEIFEYEEKYSGESFASKLTKLRNIIREKGGSSCLLTSPESICWLTNLRAKDNEYCPIILANLYVDFEKVILFTNKRELPKGIQIEVKDFSELDNFLRGLKEKIILSDNANLKIQNIFSDENKVIIKDPVEFLKAEKNEIELENFKEIHKIDAASLIDFYAWLSQNGEGFSEYEIGKKLTEFRARSEKYIMNSFPPIVGFADNGAVIHYRANKETSNLIKGDGLLLIDSGGHYYGGTTDVTRVTVFGKASKEQKDFYTRVLKGHIALALLKFPKNITGANIDSFARKSLWDIGCDYAHGTGHGVGNALSVHEGPQSISSRSNDVILKEGMIVSNEPGYYKDGEFGIRIENLQFVKKSSVYDNFFEFEQLTLVPYCKELIDFDILNNEEKEFLIEYNAKILKEVAPLLEKNSLEYLKTQIWEK